MSQGLHCLAKKVTNAFLVFSFHSIASCGYTSDFLLARVPLFFSNFVASPAREGRYTSNKLKAARNAANYQCDFVAKVSTLATFFFAIFSAFASPVRGWLHLWFSSRAGVATIWKKSHHRRDKKIARVAAALFLRYLCFSPFLPL